MAMTASPKREEKSLPRIAELEFGHVGLSRQIDMGNDKWDKTLRAP